MNPIIPVPQRKYTVTLKAGYSGKLIIEDLENCEVLNLMQFIDRMKYIDYYDQKTNVSFVVEPVSEAKKDGNDSE